MALKASDLSKSILSALKGQFKKDWPQIKDYTEAEAKNLAQTFVQLQVLRLKGKPEGELSALFANSTECHARGASHH